MKNLRKLIHELNEEAYEFARAKALYDHLDGHHTPRQRQKMLGHELVRAQVLKEIEHQLQQLPAV